MTRGQAEMLIRMERDHQEELKRAGRFPYTCADAQPDPCAKLAILAEEFGEVARAICESDHKNLKEELVQTAAICLAWLESL